MAKSKGKKKIIFFSLLALVIIGVVVYGKYSKRVPPVSITKEKTARRNLTEEVVANGKIEPVLEVKISPEVSGEIIQLEVKEGQRVKKGDLLLKIRPDNYVAARDSAKANFKYAIANKNTSDANLEKAYLEFKRNEALFQAKLISESDFLTAKTSYDVAKTTLAGAVEQVSIAQAQLNSAEADLSKTVIYSPLDGTISKLISQLGERVVGTATMAGTEIMTVANLTNMEARVDVGEMDVPLIAVGQKAHLEVDSFKDQKFNGLVSEIADSANNNDTSTATTSTDATKFQVKIHITDREAFLPGMSVTADIETRYRTNVLTIPIQSVTTRLPKVQSGGTNAAATNQVGRLAANDPPATNAAKSSLTTNSPDTNAAAQKKPDEPPKPIEVVFVVEGDHVKMVPVKRGISDDNYVEILDGLREGQEVVSGGYKAINRDLADDAKTTVSTNAAVQDKEIKPN
ncbi:MAG: efflux RND transporter periplasmic adaptor subunit [Verrucomicrobiota bacterium]|jgi:HlyD family secretion protein